MNDKHLGKGSTNPALLQGKLRMYSMRFCPYAQRAHLVLDAKKIPYDIVNIKLSDKPEWFLEKYPLGKVPAIETESGDSLYESLIISDYLDEKYPERPLQPKDPMQKAKDRILVEHFSKITGNLYKLFYGADNTFDAILMDLDLFEKELTVRATDSFNPVCETKQEEFGTDHFRELMQHLTLNPGKFDDLVTPLVDTFRLWLGDADTLSFIVNAIVDQSIMEPNFRYNGARLCHFLDSEFQTEERMFRKSLLNRCKEEHIQISKYINTDPGRLHGYVLFMAELFMQLEFGKGCGTRLAILGAALLETLSLLLDHPTSTSGNIKCACQVLKLTGQPLDAYDPVNMNKVMECLTHLLNSVVLEPNVHYLISSVIELRHVGWGDASNCMPHTNTSQLYNPCLNGPVFYGPDGQIMTPEERQFLQESVGRIPDHEEYDDYGEGVDNGWEPDDEMDEEMLAAYEQFLEMGKTQSKDSDSTHSECSG